ncbi:hypothetical protein GCM10017784_32520 [Deinococcus indicus]|uniref:phage head spike fiber domain-containing protein n=1 Tax=Deinococcus indicus TaxID=223556 RepID=UPI00174D36B8|nr:LamG-like jellyroll fold domain-containing protein [Deinococcus indicus]GHG35928.1 hypothetical protein GCM10017784_32520 [Deinococcus indicus]
MSLAAGVLTAALALPPQGLVVAYDFARVNLLNWSEDFTNTAWGKVRVNFAANKLTQDATANASHDIRYQLSGIADNSPLTFFADLAPGEMRYVHLQVSTKGAIYPRVAYDLIDGTSVTVANSVLIAAHGVQNRPDGTKRCWITVNSVGTGGAALTAHVMLALNTTGPGTMFNGDGTSGVLLYRAQVSVNPTLEYERTTDAQLLLDRSVRLWPAPAARTNFLIWTEDFTQSAWTKAGLTPSDPAQTDPLTGAKATRMTVTTMDPYLVQFIPGNPSGLTITYTVRVKMEGSVAGRQFRFYSYGASSTEALVPSGNFVATGDWQTISFTRTFPAGMASTTHVWRIDLPENGQVVGDTVLIAAPTLHYGATALPYERQTDGVTYDLSQRGMRNLISNSELARTSDSQLPTGWSLQLPSGLSASYSYGLSAAGVPYLQVTLTGAVSSGGQAFNLYMAPTGAGGVPITPGATYSVAVDAVQVSGPAMALQVGTHQWSTSGTYTATSGASGATTGAGDEPRRLGGAVTMLAATQFATPRLGATVAWPVESSQTRVYRISQPQLELGSVPTTYQRSPSHGTLGSSTGPDSNDPAWTPQGIQFDGVDDRITASGLSLSANNTALVVFSAPTPSIDFTSYLQVETAQNGRARISTMLNNRLVMECLGSTYKAVSTPNNGFTPNVPICAAVSFTSEGVVNGYVNGRLIGSTTGGVSASKTRASLQFGMRDGGGAFASGVIHYAALWDRTLTDAEVAQAYRFIRNQLSRRGVTI